MTQPKDLNKCSSASLRDLDKWASEFVGQKIRAGEIPGVKAHWLAVDDLEQEIDQWHPSSPDAPLWQMGTILKKVKNSPYAINELTWKIQAWENPAAVLRAIREVVENG